MTDSNIKKTLTKLSELNFSDIDPDLTENALSQREQGVERARKSDYPELPDEWKNDLSELSDTEKATLLGMTMRSLRGSFTPVSEREALIHFLCENIDCLPQSYLDEVRWNAYLCNGDLIDGRIFRDGDRRNGFHGSMSVAVTGDDRTDTEWNGTYRELWEMGYEPSDETVDKLAVYIPHDMNYSEKYETCIWKEDKEIEPDVPHTRPALTEISYGEADKRAPRELLLEEETHTLPLGLRHVIRPEGDKPFVVVL